MALFYIGICLCLQRRHSKLCSLLHVNGVKLKRRAMWFDSLLPFLSWIILPAVDSALTGRGGSSIETELVGERRTSCRFSQRLLWGLCRPRFFFASFISLLSLSSFPFLSFYLLFFSFFLFRFFSFSLLLYSSRAVESSFFRKCVRFLSCSILRIKSCSFVLFSCGLVLVVLFILWFFADITSCFPSNFSSAPILVLPVALFLSFSLSFTAIYWQYLISFLFFFSIFFSHQLRCFLHQRVEEMRNDEGVGAVMSMASAPQRLRDTSVETIQSYISAIDKVRTVDDLPVDLFYSLNRWLSFGPVLFLFSFMFMYLLFLYQPDSSAYSAVYFFSSFLLLLIFISRSKYRTNSSNYTIPLLLLCKTTDCWNTQCRRHTAIAADTIVAKVGTLAVVCRSITTCC